LGQAGDDDDTTGSGEAGMDEFRDRVAVVTGGASGIGRALAARFAAAGMRLVLADVEEAALAATVAELEAAGASVVGVGADVAVAADVDRVRDRALEAFGAVHLVCNNAGVGGGGIIDAPLELWDWVLGVNLYGVVHGVHTFLPLLLEQDEGHIVNTASLAGLGGVAALGVYCTSKFAVVGLSESLHHDLAARGSNVGVSVLCPGFVQTNIGRSDRNAPESLRAWVDSRDAAGMRDMAEALAAAGIPPATVADAVFDAVAQRRFFVVPHEHVALATTRARLQWMEGGDPPHLDASRAVQP
jgi:NAD(P)-dependent dehydrogenase (short-subunit alcohol dehydrogenase family)